MDRRTLLKMIAATPVTLALSPALAQQKEFNPRPGAWRTFELTTRAEVLNPGGVTRVWLPDSLDRLGLPEERSATSGRATRGSCRR